MMRYDIIMFCYDIIMLCYDIIMFCYDIIMLCYDIIPLQLMHLDGADVPGVLMASPAELALDLSIWK